MSIELAQTVNTYDVEYKGKNYALIRTIDHNVGYPDTVILCEGEPVDDDWFEKIMEYFEEQVDDGNVEF